MLLSSERYRQRDLDIRRVVEGARGGRVTSEEELERFAMGVAQVAARVVLRGGGGGEEVDEVAAETLLRVWGAISEGRWKSTSAPMAAYVSRVARNNLLYRRERERVRNRREVPVDLGAEDLDLGIEPSKRKVEDEVMMGMMVRAVERGVEGLPKMQREVMELLPTHTREEICATLGISDSSLRNRIYRGRETLRETCKDWL